MIGILSAETAQHRVAHVFQAVLPVMEEGRVAKVMNADACLLADNNLDISFNSIVGAVAKRGHFLKSLVIARASCVAVRRLYLIDEGGGRWMAIVAVAQQRVHPHDQSRPLAPLRRQQPVAKHDQPAPVALRHLLLSVAATTRDR